mmetsp:Transcript_16106/g.30418  ORF Transcript_16106/g.30418 Transcript_16106/m.30418 type:complete len:223 (-) Transcript_16106:820-1488(-)
MVCISCNLIQIWWCTIPLESLYNDLCNRSSTHHIPTEIVPRTRMYHGRSTTKCNNSLIFCRQWPTHWNVAKLLLFNINNLDPQMIQSPKTPILTILKTQSRPCNKTRLFKKDSIILERHSIHERWRLLCLFQHILVLVAVVVVVEMICTVIKQCHGLLIIRTNTSLIYNICLIHGDKCTIGNLKSRWDRFNFGIFQNKLCFVTSTIQNQFGSHPHIFFFLGL